MSAELAVRPALTPEAVMIEQDRNVLTRINEAEIGLVIWERPCPRRLADIAAAAGLERLSWRGEVSRRTEPSASGCPAELLPLLGDLLRCADACHFFEDSLVLRVRLEAVEDDGCRRFHIDNVPARLVTTYHGAGTEWVPPGWADPTEVRGDGYAGPRRSLTAGDVAVFKGAKTSGSPLILHRSPPVRALDEVRFVGVIDAAV